ncbi:flagellar biosynthetic protein FliQ [Luteibacter sp. CQ10]|uniref:flagellar biosynthetic protein FliQ n=1 Tax=Luteibacter sp. CQ10 TaxID=2805821 RepID=UPI0034A53BA4
MEDQGQIIDVAFRTALLASSPALLAAMLIGIVVGLLQSVVQVQDQAIAYVLKLGGVCAVLLASARWMMRQMEVLFGMILDAIPLAGVVA